MTSNVITSKVDALMYVVLCMAENPVPYLRISRYYTMYNGIAQASHKVKLL